MTEILRRKILKLVHGDDGVALVVTLALFMLLYVSCAGVFAVGQAVKERIILQNAVDAAAYSAAVVQADTLSRIATINRVMASTYNRMVLRQMDYINDKWLTYACLQYKTIEALSSYIGSEIEGASSRVKLSNREFSVSPLADDVASECELFDQGAAAVEIAECREAISKMNDVIDAMLHGDEAEHGAEVVWGGKRYVYKSIKEEMKRVAELVLEANVPERIARKCGYKFYIPDVDTWMVKMSELTDEETFVKMARNGEEAWQEFRHWFDQEGDEYLRSYTDDVKENQDLCASWHWKNKLGYYQGQVSVFASDVKGDDDFFNGREAVPYVPSPEYFQGKGAVSVAVVRKNENPWAGFVEPSGDSYGLYDAFKPIGADSSVPGRVSDCTLVVASAQAGYRNRALGEKKPKGGESEEEKWRTYVLSGGDVSVYGKSDDWDALFVPVAYALKDGGLRKNIVDGSWDPLGDDDELDFVDLTSSHPAFRNMHNNNAARSTLQWEELLELMYH